jgi:PIN domain nuclease of toxin-antitoxin system
VAGLLLDTCTLIWLVAGEELAQDARGAIDSAAREQAVTVSPISAWELATLARKGRVTLTLPLERWFQAVLELPGVSLAPMPPSTLIGSAFLPGDPPNDPADRILAATARAEDAQLVTRDRKLLSYGAAGHIRALAC